ncbi:MAG: uroporphyrinogen-III synthase [Flavobacteriaceae bacterium]|nr:uroporphyrinogen-III synthase [Flavobacteriaceae bacterium]
MTNPLVLSTKKLRFHQLERLMAAQCDVVDYDALQIEIQPFSIPKKPNYWVFSSQNAVRSFLANPTASAHQNPMLCVGEKTKLLLEKNGQKVIKTAQNMLELVDFIQKTMKNEHFLHICGNRKLPHFATGMQSAEISYAEVTAYQTHLVSRLQTPEPQGLLFYSPSGVESYLQTNSIGASWCFCIGETTATAVRPLTEHLTVSPKPDADLLVAAAATHFRR